MKRLDSLFDVKYGNSFELNRLHKDLENGVDFIARTSKNNGVVAKVKLHENIKPFPAGLLTVSLGGSVLETFLQPLPFYTAYHIYCLFPKEKLTLYEKLFYCMCIRANKFKYSYGRQANRTLAALLIPMPA
ncbi:MAG: restriction endonuclease subunit S [Bacteroidetes bacterium]|nr:restriction endonuclease subunit S [Bacteroidota bacterium]